MLHINVDTAYQPCCSKITTLWWIGYDIHYQIISINLIKFQSVPAFKMGMLCYKNIKYSRPLCLLSTILLQFCNIKCYHNDGSFGLNGFPLLPFDTHLQDSLYGSKHPIFPESSKEELLMG